MNKNIKWLGIKDPDFYGFHGSLHDGLSAVKYYNNKITERRELYPSENKPAEKAEKIVNELKDNGFHKVEGFFGDTQKDILENVKQTIIDFTDDNKNIKKRDANMAFINQPILNIPNLYKVIFNKDLIDLITSFYECIPALSSIAVRRSYLTDAAPVNNQYFHRDYNSLVKILKAVIYLNDVGEDDGPFTYVAGSSNKMFDNWWDYHYLNDQTLQELYGEENILPLTANFGDLLFANTRGWHKGAKPQKKERIAIHACFLIHPELTGPGHRQESPQEDWFQINKEDYENIPDNLKPVADFLIKV